MSTSLCAGIDEIRAAAQLRVALDKKLHRTTPDAVIRWATYRSTGACPQCGEEVDLWIPADHTEPVTFVHPPRGPECPGSCKPPKEARHA